MVDHLGQREGGRIEHDGIDRGPQGRVRTALVSLVPLFIVTAILIKLDSRGPVFYASLRAGRYQKPFGLFKFRSMVNDSVLIGALLSTPVDDPRITRVGRIIRRLNIDELPQLLNVLRGQMSLVGPRPESPHYVDLQTEEDRTAFERRRRTMPPTITLRKSRLSTRFAPGRGIGSGPN